MNNLRAVSLTVLLLVFLSVGAAARSVHPASSPAPAGMEPAGVFATPDTLTASSEALFFGVLAFVALVIIWNIICSDWIRPVDTRVIVLPDIRYPDNHHVPGVGYYHAAFQRWYPLPWNEFRDGRGYYYGGEWHPVAAPPTPEMTFPDPDHVHEVNRLWRNAGPEHMSGIWGEVERDGFGTAMASLEWRSRRS